MTDHPALLFDFGGTLDADGIPWAVRFYAAYRAAGGTTEFAAFEPLFKISDRTLERLPDIRSCGYLQMIATQTRLLCDLLPDGAKLDSEQIVERFHTDARAVVARNTPLLARLSRELGFRLGIVSNFTGNLELCLSELGLLELFVTVTDSAVVGMMKPDRRLFSETLERMGATAATSWMVGDNFEADIRPAAALGLRTCWIAPADRRAPEGLAPTIRIDRLTELEPLLVSGTARASA